MTEYNALYSKLKMQDNIQWLNSIKADNRFCTSYFHFVNKLNDEIIILISNISRNNLIG
jgi:hypothetical protein